MTKLTSLANQETPKKWRFWLTEWKKSKFLRRIWTSKSWASVALIKSSMKFSEEPLILGDTPSLSSKSMVYNTSRVCFSMDHQALERRLLQGRLLMHSIVKSLRLSMGLKSLISMLEVLRKRLESCSSLQRKTWKKRVTSQISTSLSSMR
jgi:hypothetical protein